MTQGLELFRSKRSEWAVLSIIVLLAAVLRLYQLDRVPPGLAVDEALNGMLVLNMLETGERPIFFEDSRGGL